MLPLIACVCVCGFVFFVFFRGSCLASRLQLLWNWLVGGSTLIATPCRGVEMYITCAYTRRGSAKCRTLMKFLHIKSELCPSPSALFQCVLATYGILVVTAGAYLMHRQNKREPSGSTAWGIRTRHRDVCIHRRKWVDTTYGCQKAGGCTFS